ncbi:MAG: hypothetical protein GWP14_08600 [Actinobacteria bacterium]|nr:hypothetical protein [Actinomycetota bacterium]
MTQKRLIAVLLFFFVTAFAVAHLEARKVRSAGRIAHLNRRVLQLSYQQWDAQARLARLCGPAELLQRTSRMALGTVAPNTILAADATTAGTELAFSR